MPIYEYDCPECGRFETIQKHSEKPLDKCPHCSAAGKESKVQRMVSQAAFHLKGSGWYKTDYGSSNGSGKPSAPPKQESEAPKSEKSDGDAGSKSSSDGSTGSCGGGCKCH